MAGKILIINQGTMLMVNRLVSLLKEAEIEPAVVEPDIDQVGAEMGDSDVFVFFTGDFVFDTQDFLTYLSNVCLDSAKPLCVVGYEKELAKVKSSISQNVIVYAFPRPFDIKNLSAEICALMPSETGGDAEKNILLVDDDATFLRMIQNCLKTHYKVAAACSGMQAIEYLTKHKVDLILLDYDMPVTSGPQVLEMLRSEPATKHIPVIFLTGKNDRDSVMSVMSFKPEGYILKSMRQEDILASLSRFFKL